MWMRGLRCPIRLRLRFRPIRESLLSQEKEREAEHTMLLHSKVCSAMRCLADSNIWKYFDDSWLVF